MKRYTLQLLYLSFFALFIISCSSDDSAVREADPTIANKQNLGSSAEDFLSAAQFTSMRVEIAYVNGFRPSQTTINNLVNFLQNRLNKPDGITLLETIVPATTKGTLETSEIVAIENANRTVYNSGDELGVWVFYADQSSNKDEGNKRILGTAYRNTSCVIFEKTIQEISQNFNSAGRTMIESVTTQHEFGHLFGLVNLGTPMIRDHEDESANDNGDLTPNKHCDQENCLMYFQTVSNVPDMLNMTEVPDFGPFCLEDLRANGGK